MLSPSRHDTHDTIIINAPIDKVWGELIDINDWECNRGYPRQASELLIPRNIREQILLDIGCSHREIIKSIRRNNKIRNQRIQNFVLLRWLSEAFKGFLLPQATECHPTSSIGCKCWCCHS